MLKNSNFCQSKEGMELISLETFISRGPVPLLGIDISSSAVKLVELGRQPDGSLLLEHCGIEPFGRGWVNEGNVEKFDEVVQALRRLLRRCDSKTRHVALALPGSAVITRKIVLAADLGPDELEAQVQAEASQCIPFPLTEVSLDFCVIGPSATAPDMQDVLLAASRKEKVSDRQALAEAAGLVPVVMDVEPYASRLAASRVIESLPRQGRDALIALFEIGSNSTSLQVIRNDDVIYERDQVFGGALLTQQIAQQYGMDFDEADAKKKSLELPSDYESTVLAPFLDNLGQEIGRALQFFFTSTPHNKVDHVLLAGGCAALPRVVESVATQTSFACQVINPFDGMALGPEVKAGMLASEATSYLVATGLALRRFQP
jgi:type IV pilus assembly protein PilM